MLKDELGAIVNALNQAGQSASFAEKYGPYFFAIALLVITPFICKIVFASALTSKNPDVRKRAMEDFRFYFRRTSTAGLFCVVAGVGWWMFESYRESSRTQAYVVELKGKVEKFDTLTKSMNFAAYGVISAGIKAEDNFYATLIDPRMSIVFAKLPANIVNSEASWFFVVLSNQELPPALEFNVGWSQRARDGDIGAILNMPMKLMLAKKYGLYKFSLEQDAANVRPIVN